MLLFWNLEEPTPNKQNIIHGLISSHFVKKHFPCKRIKFTSGQLIN